MRIIVVGSGFAGLSAAYALKKAGIEVTVLEASTEPGGRVRSQLFCGVWIDLGAEFLAGIDVDQFQEPIADLGLTDQIIAYPGGKVAFSVLRGGETWPLSMTDPVSFLKFGGMSVGARLQLVRLIPAFLGQLRHGSGHLYQPWRAAWCDDQSVEQWLGRLCPEFLEYAIEPCFELYCGYEPATLGKAAFLSMMTQYGRADLITFKEGLGQLTRALASWLNVITGARVTRITPGTHPTVEFVYRDKRELRQADHVILAVPGSKVADIVDGLDPRRHAFFQQVKYTPHELHFFELRRELPDLPPCVLFPRKEEDQLASISYQGYGTNPRVKFLRPDLKTHVTRTLLDSSAQDNLQFTLEAAGRHYPHVVPLVTDSYLSRWREGLPLFWPGYLKLLEQFIGLPALPGLDFAGDYLAGPSTGAAYATGQRAAQRAMHTLSRGLGQPEPFPGMATG